MTPEQQQRKMLEAAAKACGITEFWNGDTSQKGSVDNFWNPLLSPADTAEMCAEVGIDTAWFEDKVLCAPFVGYKSWAEFKDHDNYRLKAWMYAATMVAAKIGGFDG